MPDQTKRNLREAFAGESQANRRYLAFAKRAADQGYPNVARLLRVVAESETIHAHNHLGSLKEIKDTLDNLQTALKGEVHEVTSMYPMFMDQAKRDADNEALKSFYWANEAEKTHQVFFERAIAAVQQGKDPELKDLYICKVCGYTVEGQPPEKCPTCKRGKEEFIKLN